MTAPQPFSHRTHTTTTREVDGKTVPVAARSAEIQAKVDAWAAANPEISTSLGSMSLAPAAAFASVGLIHQDAVNEDGSPYTFEQMWIDRFTRDPDLMWMMVGDIVRYVSADERPRGTRVSSRRQVQDKDRNLSAVWRIIHGHYSTEPFPVALDELIGDRSLRWFAGRANMHVTTLIRYRRGERALTMPVMESCASAGRVEPHYFLEYRAAWLAQELQKAMLARPQESLRALKQIRDAVV